MAVEAQSLSVDLHFCDGIGLHLLRCLTTLLIVNTAEGARSQSPQSFFCLMQIRVNASL